MTLYTGKDSDTGEPEFSNGAFWTNHATADERPLGLLRAELTPEERERAERARRRLDPGPLYDPAW
jgi:hypothetical protein